MDLHVERRTVVEQQDAGFRQERAPGHALPLPTRQLPLVTPPAGKRHEIEQPSALPPLFPRHGRTLRPKAMFSSTVMWRKIE
jgi:hypothetical protein